MRQEVGDLRTSVVVKASSKGVDLIRHGLYAIRRRCPKNGIHHLAEQLKTIDNVLYRIKEVVKYAYNRFDRGGEVVKPINYTLYRIDDPPPHARKDLHLLSEELDIEHHYPLDDLTDSLKDGHKISLKTTPQFFDTRP